MVKIGKESEIGRDRMKKFNLENVSDDFQGLYVHKTKQYWFYGKGYFREWRKDVVYHKSGKRLGKFSNPKVREKLRKLLKEED